MSSIAAIEQPSGLVSRWGAWILLPILFVNALARVWLFRVGAIPFNSDEAVVALMARHINQLKEIPIFFYGQEYMGSLDAILVAIGYQILEERVAVIRVVQFILYCIWAWTTYLLIFSISKSSKLASLGSFFFVIPTVNVFLYSSVSLGGYGEALVVGNFILIVGLTTQAHAARRPWVTTFLWFLLGLLIGFGFWVFGLTLVYSAAVIFYLMYSFVNDTSLGKFARNMKYWLVACIGLLFGLMPVVYHLMTRTQTAVLSEILGSAIAQNTQGLSTIESILTRIFSLIFLGLPVVVGIRPPWSVDWLVLILIPGVIFFWAAAVIALKTAWKKNEFYLPQSSVILLVGILTILGFIVTPFGNDPSGRYFLPLYVPMILTGSLYILMVSRRWNHWIWILPLFLITYNFLALMQVARNNPPGLTTQFDKVAQVDHQSIDSLIEFLQSNNITRGYTNYWVSYPLAFLSHEELIFIPSLPYHEDFRYTTRDRRYPPYENLVMSSQDIAYITTHHSELDTYLRSMFTKRNIRWQEKFIGDYHIFYQLSAPVHAEEIGLGNNHE